MVADQVPSDRSLVVNLAAANITTYACWLSIYLWASMTLWQVFGLWIRSNTLVGPTDRVESCNIRKNRVHGANKCVNGLLRHAIGSGFFWCSCRLITPRFFFTVTSYNKSHGDLSVWTHSCGIVALRNLWLLAGQVDRRHIPCVLLYVAKFQICWLKN